MPNSEQKKTSKVLRRLNIRLYDKDEDIADYLRNQKTTTLNSFIRFLIRDALEKYGDQDYFQAIKKLGDIERKTLAPKVEAKAPTKNYTQEVQINTASSPTTPAAVSSKPKGEKQPKAKVIDTSKEVRRGRIAVKRRGEHLKKKRKVLENLSDCPKTHMIFLKMEIRLNKKETQSCFFFCRKCICTYLYKCIGKCIYIGIKMLIFLLF